MFPSKSSLKSLSGSRLVCPLAGVQSIAAQYALFHHADDFACFAMALAEVEGFDRRRRQHFTTLNRHFPAPSLGVMRASLLISQMKVLVAAWDVFFEHYYTQREGAQRRVGGFLLERLHSFLLYEELERGVEFSVGYLNIVSDTDKINATT